MITPKGYRRIYDAASKRLRMEHDVVWERANGPIPVGLAVHHINHDKLDNRIENLELMDAVSHKRHHSGCELRGNVWWKPCRKCGTLKPISDYYGHQTGVLSWCKPCQIANAVRNKRRRRARKMRFRLFAQLQEHAATLDSDGRSFGEITAERQPAA
jgi:hypothetical protein